MMFEYNLFQMYTKFGAKNLNLLSVLSKTKD